MSYLNLLLLQIILLRENIPRQNYKPDCPQHINQELILRILIKNSHPVPPRVIIESTTEVYVGFHLYQFFDFQEYTRKNALSTCMQDSNCVLTIELELELAAFTSKLAKALFEKIVSQ